MMPREIAILDAYMPTVVLMFVLGALATEPSTACSPTRASTDSSGTRRCSGPAFVCICGGLSLAVYR